MKKYYVFAILISTFSTVCFAKTHPVYDLKNLPPGVAHVSCDIDNKHCVGVGVERVPSDGGCATNPFTCPVLISYISEDGGSQWQRSHHIPTYKGSGWNALHGLVCSDDGLQCHTVGYSTWGSSVMSDATILYSKDGGNNWNESSRPTSNYPPHDILFTVDCDPKGIRCAAAGQIVPGNVYLSYYTIDGGVNWFFSKTPPKLYHNDILEITQMACDNEKNMSCIAIGIARDNPAEFCKYLSKDGGMNWALADSLSY